MLCGLNEVGKSLARNPFSIVSEVLCMVGSDDLINYSLFGVNYDLSVCGIQALIGICPFKLEGR